MSKPEPTIPTEVNLTTGFDLPDDARCLHCGYRLRGLTEPRCPECGSSFDPKTIPSIFTPRWPELLIWWLAGGILPLVLFLLFIYPEILNEFKRFLRRDFAFQVFFVSACLDLVCRCLFGPFVLYGLWRGRDWARRLCCIILTVLATAWIFNFGVQLIIPLRGADPNIVLIPPMDRDIVLVQAIRKAISIAIPSAIVVAYLLTGFRRHSLRRRENLNTPWLSLAWFDPRGDWLLLGLILIAGLGLHWLGRLVDIGLFWQRVSWDEPRIMVFGMFKVIGIAWCVTTIVRALRDPTSLRWNTAILCGIIAINLVFPFARSLTTMKTPAPVYLDIIWAFPLAFSIDEYLVPLLPYLAVLLFLFIRLDDKDIAQVTQKNVRAGRA